MSVGKKWRVLAQGPGRKRFEARDTGVEFDELVVEDFFHIERMDTRSWWMRAGTGDSSCTFALWYDRRSKTWRVRLTDGELS